MREQAVLLFSVSFYRQQLLSSLFVDFVDIVDIVDMCPMTAP
jgi:hypothetical protein